MDELVDRVSLATGLEPDTAHAAIGIVLHFIERQLPPQQSAVLLDAIPGAREAAAGGAAEDADSGGSGLAGGDFAGGDLMALAGQLGAAGLGMGEMQDLGRAMFAFLREKAGDEAVGGITAAIPGLQSFI